MNTKSDLREFAQYTFLNVLGMIGLSCYILADTFFVAKGMGSNGLTALNLAIPVYSFIHGSGLMLGMGGATRYSILKHQGRLNEAQEVYTHTMCLGAVLAAFFVLCGLVASDRITTLLGADEAVYSMTKTYLRVLLLFSPLFLLNDITLAFVRNDGAPQLAMCGLMGSSFSNIILDYIFIFALDMGIFGAVLATSIAPAISLAVFIPFFRTKRNSFHLVRCPAKLPMVRSITAAGLPSLVTEVSSGVVMIVFNRILLSLHGNLAVAAYGVVSNLALVVTAIYTGIAQGSQPLMSRCHGAGEPERAKTLLRYAICLSMGLSILIYGIMFFGADPIAAVFNRERDMQLQSMAVWGLKVYFTSCFFVGLNVVLATYFTSTERAQSANIMSILRGFAIVIPLAFLLAWLGGMTGLWCTVMVTELFVAVIGVYFYTKGAKIPM